MERMFLTADGWYFDGYGHYRKGDLHVWSVAAGLYQAWYQPLFGIGLADTTTYSGPTAVGDAKAAAERLAAHAKQS